MASSWITINLFSLHDVLSTSTLLICLVVFILVYHLVSHINRQLPPGPLGLPLIGSLHTLLLSVVYYGEHPHDLMARLTRKHGKVFCLGFGGNSRLVVLNSFTSVAEAFKNPDVTDRPDNAVSGVLGANGILSASGSNWKHQRRFSLAVFRSFGVGRKSFEDRIATEADNLSDEFIAISGRPFNPKHHLMNATSNVICSIVFGQRFDYNDDKFKNILANLDQRIKLAGAGALPIILPKLGFLVPNVIKQSRDLTLDAMEYFRPIVENHKSRLEDADECTDLIDLYLKEIQKARQDGDEADEDISENHLFALIDSLFVAGTETSSNTLGWSFLYMAAHPEIQDRVLGEIRSVCGERLPAYSDQDHMPYTEAVITEIQRMHTIVPLGVPHCAARDTTIQDYVIPKGTIVISNLWGVLHDPDVWSEPEVFKPERFLNEQGKVNLPKEWIPFSHGRRICLGERLAKMEIFIFLTHLLSKYEFKKAATSQGKQMCFEGRSGATFSPLPFEITATSRDV